MSSKVKVQECARRARAESDTGEKLNAIADAIHEFVEFVEVVEHQIRHLELRLRRMEM
jgi:hypothetical protein